MATYGYDTWYHAAWPTRDHFIPWKLFALFVRAMPRLRASQQLDMTHAVTAGYTRARVPKQHAFRLTSAMRRLERFADGADLTPEEDADG